MAPWTRAEAERALQAFSTFVLQIIVQHDHNGSVELLDDAAQMAVAVNVLKWLQARSDDELRDIWHFMDFIGLMEDDVRNMLLPVLLARGLVTYG